MPVSATQWPGAQAFLAMCLLGHGCAYANDTLKINASRTQTQESNLFRLPASADPIKILGKSASENLVINTVGLSFNKAYSLQRVEIDVNLNDYKYQNFKYLSFAAPNYDASWLWFISPQFHGRIKKTKKETLDQTALLESLNLRNRQIDDYSRFDATYDIDGTWSLMGGTSKVSQVSDYAIVGKNDFDANAVELGVNYLNGPGDTSFYKLKTEQGTYINHIAVGVNTRGDYQLTEHQVGRYWHLTGKTTANIRASLLSMVHPKDPKRDFSGLKANAQIDWKVTGKSAISLNWNRELSTYQTFNTNYTQTDSFSIGPTWWINPKTILRIQHERNLIRFLGSPSSDTSNSRQDVTKNTTLAIDWHPTDYLTLNASIQQATRASNVVDYDFLSNIVNLSARMSY